MILVCQHSIPITLGKITLHPIQHFFGLLISPQLPSGKRLHNYGKIHHD